jgi:hypothetical protein
MEQKGYLHFSMHSFHYVLHKHEGYILLAHPYHGSIFLGSECFASRVVPKLNKTVLTVVHWLEISSPHVSMIHVSSWGHDGSKETVFTSMKHEDEQTYPQHMYVPLLKQASFVGLSHY